MDTANASIVPGRGYREMIGCSVDDHFKSFRCYFDIRYSGLDPESRGLARNPGFPIEALGHDDLRV